MEKKANAKITNYVDEMRLNIITKIQEGVMDDSLTAYIQEYPLFSLDSEDFTKRKRVKNIVPYFERCCALRANGEQCTRRKKNNPKFCGTHIKGTPHGEITQTDTPKTHTKKTCWAQEIKGIIYYIDDGGNVYDTDDILGEAVNPRIIAKYEKKGDNYDIPAFFK